MEEEYEMLLELGLSSSAGDHIDWNVWACVIVHKDDNSKFSFDIKWFKDAEYKHHPEMFNNYTVGLSATIVEMMRLEASIKFFELMEKNKNEQY